MALTEERDTFVIMDSFSPLRPESIPAPREDTFKKPLLSIMVPPASLSSSVEPVLERKNQRFQVKLYQQFTLILTVISLTKIRKQSLTELFLN